MPCPMRAKGNHNLSEALLQQYSCDVSVLPMGAYCTISQLIFRPKGILVRTGLSSHQDNQPLNHPKKCLEGARNL